jgi:hypothetical protein
VKKFEKRVKGFFPYKAYQEYLVEYPVCVLALSKKD